MEPKQGYGIMAFRAFVVLTLCVITLYSCRSPGVKVPDGYYELPICEIQTIRVEDLDTGIGEGCNLLGSIIVFPDGITHGVMHSTPSLTLVPMDRKKAVTYSVHNWGVPGVSASMTRYGKPVQVWASTPEARELHRQAFNE